MTRDELVECAAFVRAARAGRLEETCVPRHPLDVLAQQIVAEAAARLFDALHRADASDRARIAVAPLPATGIGEAIHDRLRRAATR